MKINLQVAKVIKTVLMLVICIGVWYESGWFTSWSIFILYCATESNTGLIVKMLGKL